MSIPINETGEQLHTSQSAANQGASSSGGTAQLKAPEFSIDSGGDRELSDKEQDVGEHYLDDILGEDGSEDDIDDLFGKGFASRFSDGASFFEAAWADLGKYKLGESDKGMASADHQTGADIMDALIGVMIEALTGPEENIDFCVGEGKLLIQELEISTDLLQAYVTLFGAIDAKDIVPMLIALCNVLTIYDYAELRGKVMKLEADTKKLRELVDAAYKALAMAGVETAIDLGAIALETSILASIGVANPVLGGIIMMGVVYGAKYTAGEIIKPPEGPEESMGSYLITKSDESLDLLSKGMEAGETASDGFKNSVGKIGKFKTGLTKVMGVANTTKAAYDVKKLEDYFTEYEKNNLGTIQDLNKDFSEKVLKTGALAKNLYKAGLEIGPTIDKALADIILHGDTLDNFREE